MENQFFVVWNPAHGLPHVQHSTYKLALAEAKRLALFNRGQKFHVLGAMALATTEEPVKVTTYPVFDDMF